MAGQIEWTEMDEQMAREGEARTRSFKSVGQQKKVFKSKDTLLPGKASVPRGNGPSPVFQTAAQTLAANDADRVRFTKKH